ncbi:MAG: hypothetical protein WCG01_05355 [bacterium]
MKKIKQVVLLSLLTFVTYAPMTWATTGFTASDSKIYTNKITGISFRYPSDLTYKEVITDNSNSKESFEGGKSIDVFFNNKDSQNIFSLSMETKNYKSWLYETPTSTDFNCKNPLTYKNGVTCKNAQLSNNKFNLSTNYDNIEASPIFNTRALLKNKNKNDYANLIFNFQPIDLSQKINNNYTVTDNDAVNKKYTNFIKTSSFNVLNNKNLSNHDTKRRSQFEKILMSVRFIKNN